MPKDDSARKRRRVEATGISAATEEPTGAVVFDDEAMKRHMLSLMQQPTNGNAQDSDSDEEEGGNQESENGDDDYDSEEEDDAESFSQNGADQSEATGKRTTNELDSTDDEDEDDTARALLQGRGTVNTAHHEQTASRISRIPANIITTPAPKKPALRTTFEGLGLSPQLIRTLAGISIRKPTEIQSACFEHILNGKVI